jgi:hypothetical protein
VLQATFCFWWNWSESQINILQTRNFRQIFIRDTYLINLYWTLFPSEKCAQCPCFQRCW